MINAHTRVIYLNFTHRNIRAKTLICRVHLICKLCEQEGNMVRVSMVTPHDVIAEGDSEIKGDMFCLLSGAASY